MRIHPIQQTLDVYKSQSTAQVKKVNTNKPKDALEVSNVAKEYQVAYQALKQVPDVRADKIAALKEKVQSGTYSVDAMEISEKMISQLDLRG